MSEEMTREQAIRVMMNERPHCGKKITLPEGIRYEAYNVAIAALEAEPCEDAISRTRAMETFAHWAEHKDYTHVERHILHAVVDELRAMPSISYQPDEWTPILKDLYDGFGEGT